MTNLQRLADTWNAYVEHDPELFAALEHDVLVLHLVDAAEALLEGDTWDLLPSVRPIPVEITGSDEYTAFAILVDEPTSGLWLFEDEDALEDGLERARAGRAITDGLGLQFRDDLIAIVAAVPSLTHAPMPIYYEIDEPMPLGDVELAVLVAAAQAIAAWARGEAPTFTIDEGEVAITAVVHMTAP